MKKSTKWNIIAMVATTLGVVGFAGFLVLDRSPADSPDDESRIPVVAETTHRLTQGSTEVTFTEFLDFECEVCAAAYPAVEQLRAEFGDRVSFTVRYFPIPAHHNSMNAALAVEAAAQQGKFEAMYHRMFATQTSWGEQQDSKAEIFRTFAHDLGLDMTEYDAAVANRATKERVQRDFDAGLALGVQGTPTFFVNETLVAAKSVEDLRRAIEDALAD